MSDPEMQVWLFPTANSKEEEEKIISWAQRRGLRAFDGIDTRRHHDVGILCGHCYVFYKSHKDVQSQLRDEGYPGQLYSMTYKCDHCNEILCIEEFIPRYDLDNWGMIEYEGNNCIVVLKSDFDDINAHEYTDKPETTEDPDIIPEPQLWKDVKEHLKYMIFERDMD